MAPDVDLLILGAGCAGLSLAWRLSELGSACPRVMMLDQRVAYTHDRTWCFWDNQDARLAGLTTHDWRWLRLRAQAKTAGFDCGMRPYQMLEAALQAIGACPAVSLRLGESVTQAPVPVAGGWQLVSSHRVVTARWVVDTRPWAAPAPDGATLWQSFYGREICCDDDIFDPQTADLMNFTEPSNGQIPFTYVLPVSKRRALVEATVFGPLPLGRVDLAAQLDAAVKACTGGREHATVRCESGILPMGLARRPPPLGAGYVAVGVMAGGARPSTGFAFQRIQQWADQCSAAIAAGNGPTLHRPDPLVVRLMDKLFLQVLRAAPQAAPGLFLALFEHADSASVIRFLSGQGSLADCWQVVRALPARHFLRQLWASVPAAVTGGAR